MKAKKVIIIIALGALLASCNTEDGTMNNENNIWTIPRNEVFDGGPGKDGIPALVNPILISASEASYLSDDDLVLGYKNGGDIRAYPHPILDWHEIINDKVNNFAIAVTYCPLTGTGIGWERTIEGDETTFGVSGLLYNSNLIPYDRKTNSNWSQIRLDCVNGELIGNSIATIPLIETTWATWKSMYPQTKVISLQTGHSRNYNRYPYGDYRTNHNNIIFPFSPKDDRLPAKERVHGVIIDGKAKAYRFTQFPGSLTVVEDEFQDVPIVVVGSANKNFIVSFSRELPDGSLLEFNTNADINAGAEILMDQEGNVWDIFGKALSGPRAGQELTPTTSFIGYWFSWGAFYPDLEIYGN
jgi:hypothetical protein